MKQQRGLDYASVDGNVPPDFVAAKKAGADFVIIRKSFVLHDVTRGLWRVVADPHFARDATRAKSARLVVGAYGFFSFAKDAPSAAEQVGVLVAGQALVRGDLPYCLDVEFPGKGVADTGRSQGAAFGFLLELVAELRRQSGTDPLIYTSHVQWHDSNGLGGPDHPDLDGCPLWIKTPYRLKEHQHLDPQAPRPPHVDSIKNDPMDLWRVPTPWVRQGWWIQQYQGDAIGFPGFDKTVDVNLYQDVDATSGDEQRIAWVQRRLCVLGAPYVGPLNATGVWDEDTERALRAFQTSHSLEPHGRVDVATFAFLCW